LHAPEDESLWTFVDKETNGNQTCLPEFSSLSSVQNFNTKYLENVGTYLHTSANRDISLNALKPLMDFECSDEACEWFVTRFCDVLAVSTEAFVWNFVKEPLEAVCINYEHLDNRDNPDNLDFQQTVYYIGRSCMRSVLRQGRNKKAERWQKVINCVKSKLLTRDLVRQPNDDIIAWTESMDRGGLQCINEVWYFLMVSSSLLKRIELPGGIILINCNYKECKETVNINRMYY